jgi:hypothetical protein
VDGPCQSYQCATRAVTKCIDCDMICGSSMVDQRAGLTGMGDVCALHDSLGGPGLRLRLYKFTVGPHPRSHSRGTPNSRLLKRSWKDLGGVSLQAPRCGVYWKFVIFRARMSRSKSSQVLACDCLRRGATVSSHCKALELPSAWPYCDTITDRCCCDIRVLTALRMRLSF